MKNKKILFSVLSMTLLLSMALVVASNQNGKVIANQNQLQTNYQYQYQLSDGEFITANLNREQAQEKVREKIQQRFKIQNCSCENIQIVELQNVQNQTRYFPVQSIDSCEFKFNTLTEYFCGESGIESQEIICEDLGLICIDVYDGTGSYCGEGEF